MNLDAPFDGPHRLTYSVRGPEWAFAVPSGDVEALDDVMRKCSQFWNGEGSLIVAVDEHGDLPPGLDVLLDTRSVECCFVHESLGDKAARAVGERFERTSRLWEGFDRDELHPLHFQNVAELAEPKPVLLIPRFAEPDLQRAALACWGYVLQTDVPAWEERFDVRYVDAVGDAARALVRGQTEVGSTSPLRLTSRYMSLIRQDNPQAWPYLVVMPVASFDACVNLWNLRSRSRADVVRGASVVGVPRQLLQDERILAPLPRWLAMAPDMQRTPDVLVAAREEDAPTADAALQWAGFDRDHGDKLTQSFGDTVEPRERPTYRYFGPHVGGRLQRGALASALVVFNEGRLAVDLPPPAGLDLRSGHRLRVVLDNLPLPTPLTDRLARRLNPEARALDGLLMMVGAHERLSFDLRLPGRHAALTDWGADKGFDVAPSQPSRYAEALLGRLDDWSGLDALADETRLGVLAQLAPTQREKLAQRLRQEFAVSGEKVDADALAERLKDVGLFLELQARDVSDLAGRLGIQSRRPSVRCSLWSRSGSSTAGRRRSARPATLATSFGWQSSTSACAAETAGPNTRCRWFSPAARRNRACTSASMGLWPASWTKTSSQSCSRCAESGRTSAVPTILSTRGRASSSRTPRTASRSTLTSWPTPATWSSAASARRTRRP